ncbi:hypothetical protein E2I00_002254 [Balaenoptera physalus]|uniref:RRM domain-containing protein n=1 Tax=Balaenoptera physalus TaxID=9770 RepID=A0A643CH95_BALPH|nr:hypothetical protein E2I00_002254 [Balaenoptera physalus]
MVTKPLGCRPPISKESSVDRPTFLDKVGVTSGGNSIPLKSVKMFILENKVEARKDKFKANKQPKSKLLGEEMRDGGLVEEPTTSPFLPSPSLKLPLSNSALPHQALGGIASGLGMQNLNSSRQVQAQLLQFAAKNIGLNPALLTSPINPQHMTMLNQLYQLQLIQQQMLQAQRNVSGPMRQQEQQYKIFESSTRMISSPLLNRRFVPSLALSSLKCREQERTCGVGTAAGLNPNMNVSSMDMTGGLSVKDPSQSQSRLPQWTHPNPMDNLPGAASPLDQNPSKHGAIPGGLSIGPPAKSSIDDSYGRYDLIQSSESPATPPVAVPHSWSRAKSDSDKISNGSSINWPPEFHPGVPWKGLQNIDPENDPDVTPGSVPTGPTINTTIQDVNRYLLKSGGSSPPSSQNATLPSSSAWPLAASGYSRSLSSLAPAPSIAGKLSDIKSTWSSGPASHTQASLSHELWKVPRNTTAPTRPPPGLTNPKPSSTWGASPLGWTSSYSSGSAWSTDTSGRTSSWLVLRNLTPQIDGSTLRTLCLQHGPLITFHLNLTQGNAVVRYSSKEEAAKAQKSLHMYFAGEEEVNRFLAQGQALPPTSSWQPSAGTSQTRLGASGSSHGLVRSDTGHWNAPCLAGKGSSDLLWGGVPQYSSSLWGPPSSDDGRVIGSPTPLNTLLPGDLLSGESI